MIRLADACKSSRIAFKTAGAFGAPGSDVETFAFNNPFFKSADVEYSTSKRPPGLDPTLTRDWSIISPLRDPDSKSATRFSSPRGGTL